MAGVVLWVSNQGGCSHLPLMLRAERFSSYHWNVED